MISQTSFRALFIGSSAPAAAAVAVMAPPLLHPTTAFHRLTTSPSLTLRYKPPTVASLRSISTFSKLPYLSLSPFARSTRLPRTTTSSSLNKKSPAPPIAASFSRSFSSSSRSSFRASPSTMVVNNLASLGDFTKAVSTTDVAAATAETPKASLVVIDCFAVWCGPCKQISPAIEEFSKTYTNVGFYKVDVDEVPDVAQELGVRAMPTFFFFKDGQKVDTVVGANAGSIKAAIEKNLA
ncbi:thioredoxin [Polytolypa hystricis UAMH7299]|uniref:Thioredoxin n=1 Tax=Polytolypa hystricis (strain UAMH7299) TaxID=1447883 RepID=A0A2B7Z128_POLH7|nr:thioredoxin [Polytolypa hystricis UAMH7299]